MTDERDKPSRVGSVARPTARDVPFVRGADSISEPAPLGQRPAQLPRDPTYEAELAQVELAVLRDPDPRTDPPTKPLGRGASEPPRGGPPESITPESPGARVVHAVAAAPHAAQTASVGRAVASGTLLSVGAVDPRGKTEPTLETPRMFFSQAGAGAEVYFKPSALPAVTVHQTLETETVKLSDSIDPRRAKTIPRLDREALAQLASADVQPESAAPLVLSGPGSSLDVPGSDAAPNWNQEECDPAGSSSRDYDAQIHASLSPFRDRAEPSYAFDGAPTRAEPLAARKASERPAPVSLGPDPNAVPTQRDLPAHRIASQPPPAKPLKRGASAAPDSHARGSELPDATSASIAAEEPERRAPWVNYAAFVAALLLALALGMYWTRPPEAADAARSSDTLPAKPTPAAIPAPAVMPGSSPAAMPGSSPAAMPGSSPAAMPGSSPAATPGSSPAAMPGSSPAATPGSSRAATPASSPSPSPVWPRAAAAPPQKSALPTPAAATTVTTAPAPAPKSNPPKTNRETIF